MYNNNKIDDIIYYNGHVYGTAALDNKIMTLGINELCWYCDYPDRRYRSLLKYFVRKL